MRQNGDKPNAIEKALQLLLAFNPHNPEMSTVEISEKLGFHKATASRILLTLTEYEFLRQDPTTKKFSLGQSVHKLGVALTGSLSNNFVHIAKPYLDQLRDTLDETVTLELWSNDSTVMTYIAESSHPVRVAGRVGDRLPFHAAAGAKAILSFVAPHRLDALLHQPLAPLTSATITDPELFKQHLLKFRAQGFAVDNEEIDVGICAVSAPIFNHENRAVAAVIVVTPTQRFDASPTSSIVQALQKTAADISKNFFYEGGLEAFNDELTQG
ncbi:MAG: IclR family transcriptional regulator [Chloroflexota bacterium]